MSDTVNPARITDPADWWKIYPMLVKTTARTDLPVNDQLANCVMGLNGEIGEVTDIIKKHLYQGHALDKDHLAEELGDVLFYYTWLSVLILDLDRADIIQRNFDKLKARYPEGFDPERSINR